MSSTIIVGGGVIGLLSAYELQRSGEQVSVIDRQQLGQESSWAGGGILSPLYPWRYPDAVTRLAALSQQLYPDFIEIMQARTGLEAEYLAGGMLVLGNYEAEDAGDWVLRHGIDARRVDGREISKIAPELNTDFDQGWWFAQIHRVRNPRLIALIRGYLETTDVKLVEHEPITEIVHEGGRVKALRSATQSFEADRYVIAGGAWSNDLLLPTGIDIGVKPIKGQMLLLKGNPGLVSRIILSEDHYIIPRQDGRILVGSTTEDSGFDKSTSAQVQQELFDYAARTIPAVASLTLERHWAGLRPGTADGIPRIGVHPQIENLFISCGHYRNGLVMAAASARLLSEIMSDQPLSLNAQDYKPCDAVHN
jgi:glycine oxidase